MNRKFLWLSLSMIVLLIVVTIILLSVAVVSVTNFEVYGKETDFEQISNGHYHMSIDPLDVGTRIRYRIDGPDDGDLEIRIVLSSEGNVLHEYEGSPPIDKEVDSTSADDMDVDLFMDPEFSIDDLRIEILSNSGGTGMTILAGILCLSMIIILLFSIVFLIMFIVSLRKNNKVEKKKKSNLQYNREVMEMKIKIKKMEDMGLDTAYEKELLKEYQRNVK